MKITTINTIELSSICDNHCQYCPAQKQREYRDCGFMARDVFEKAIGWVKHFCNTGSQLELNLFDVGEPCLHPDLVEYVKYAREALPFRQNLHLNTNGNTMTLELAKQLKQAGITAIDVTMHDAHAAAKTIRYLKQAGIDGRLSVDFVTVPNNWAGQVDWFAPEYHKAKLPDNVCPWLARGQVMVMSNGDVTHCCIDAFAQGVFATVDDNLPQLEVEEMPLCSKCHHLTPGEYRLLADSNGFTINLEGVQQNV